MCGCESCTIKKIEHWRIDAFERWGWRRLLRVPWIERRSNQWILKEISLNIHGKDWCWSWSSYISATWCEEPTHWKGPWCWERLMAEGEVGNREWNGWMASPTQWKWAWPKSGWRTGKPGVLQFMWSQSQMKLSDWTTAMVDAWPQVTSYYGKNTGRIPMLQ